MENVSDIYFYLGYVIIFSLLGLFALFMHVPHSLQLGGYRKSRILLGSAFIMMAVYCTTCLLMPKHQNEYFNFCLLAVVSLIFSWLNYTSFLFLIDASYKVRRSFIIDGVIPTMLMFILGIVGQVFTESQTVFEYLLGGIFLLKCIRMFYICENEWRRVNDELSNYDDGSLNILWMRILVWLTFLLSISTLVALYVPVIHVVYDMVAPIIYVYMVFKLINYLPYKIDSMRANDMSSSNTAGAQSLASNINSQKKQDIQEKIKPNVERWVTEKRYCTSDLSIKDVATQIGTNHTYLSFYLNNTLNMTFQIWLNTLRIEESKHILATENITIEEVGIKVGIPQSYNFSRWFKIVTGTTPFRYRKEENRCRQTIS